MRTVLLRTSKKNCIDAAGGGHEVEQAARASVVRSWTNVRPRSPPVSRHVRHAFYGRSSHRIEDEDFVAVWIFELLHGRFSCSWTRRRRRVAFRASKAGRPRHDDFHGRPFAEVHRLVLVRVSERERERERVVSGSLAPDHGAEEARGGDPTRRSTAPRRAGARRRRGWHGAAAGPALRQ